MKKIIHENKNIFFTDKGEGKCIVLLHGYLESKEIWGEFAEKLSATNRVLCIDLPAHGDSEIPYQVNSMETMAKITNQILDDLKICKCTLFGHSMGGYATMAFAELYPEKLEAIGLIHSTPYSDSEEKKKYRDREIKIVEANKQKNLYVEHFPKIFASDNVEKYQDKIKDALIIAEKMQKEGVIATLNGMKQRKDRADILADFDKPFLYVWGEKDNFINAEVVKNIKFPEKTTKVTLRKSGHMGFVEQCRELLSSVNKFMERLD